MARNEGAPQAKILPRGRKIGEGDPPVVGLLVDMRLKAESEYSVLGSAEEAFVELAVVFVRYFTPWL